MAQGKKGRKPICCTRASSSMALVIFGFGMAGILPGDVFLSIAHLARQVESQMRLHLDLPQQF